MGCPIVFRGPNGAAARVAAQHSQDYSSWYSHIPGLKVIAPYNAADAKGLLKAAIRDPNPVIFLENEILYGHSSPVPKLDDFVLPIGKARIARAGNDVTIVAWSMGMSYALKAAEELAKDGIDAEVIDLRTLRPMDTDTIVASVKKTGRVVTVEEGWPQSGVGAEIAARLMESAFDYLDAPVAARHRQGRADALRRQSGKAGAAVGRRGDRGGQSRLLPVGARAMPTNILMPALSPTMEKGNLAKWLKKEGDKVKSGDIIAEIETDKATMEFEAVDEGTLAKIVVPEGTQDVAVNAVIAVLAGEGEDVKAAAAGAKAAPAAKPAEAPKPRGSATKSRCARSASRATAEACRASHAAADGGERLATASSPRRSRAAREGSRHRSCPRAGLRPAWPRHRPRHRRGEIRQGPARAGRRACCSGRSAVRSSNVATSKSARSTKPAPTRSCRTTACAAPSRSGSPPSIADHPAFLPDHRLRHRQADGRARGDQRRRAQGQRRQARLQALGQRFRHQGAGARACSACPTPT